MPHHLSNLCHLRISITVIILFLAALLGTCISTPTPAPSPLPTSSPLPTPTVEPAVPLAPAPLPTIDPHPWTSPKRGLPLTTGNCGVRTDCPDIRLVNAAWSFGWGPGIRISPACADVDAVAMIWGAPTIANGCPVVSGGSEYLLTFNEPELNNLAPSAGAILWRWVEHCYPEKKLIAPAVVRNIFWLEEMRRVYIVLYDRPPRFHALGLHCYPLGPNLVDSCTPRLDQLEAWVRAWNIPGGVWINEWAISTKDPTWREQQHAMLFRFETDPLVTRHAWYTARERGDEPWANGSTQLLECDHHRLREAGIRYRNFRLHRAYAPLIYHP